MSNVCILGRGPSLEYLRSFDSTNIDAFLLINNHDRTVSDKLLLKKITDKPVYIMSNISQAGFTPIVFDRIEDKTCVTNRLRPNDELWQSHKNAQTKNNQGGTVNNLNKLPFLAEDEPYLYAWRGPAGRNTENMKTYNGIPIEHMPEEAEKYLLPIYADQMIGNCAYYASLYAILKLNASQITYFGIDFYNHIKILKKWYHKPPTYLSEEWKLLRLKTEGEHMKILWDKYLCNYFKKINFIFYTTEYFRHLNKNLILNIVK